MWEYILIGVAGAIVLGLLIYLWYRAMEPRPAVSVERGSNSEWAQRLQAVHNLLLGIRTGPSWHKVPADLAQELTDYFGEPPAVVAEVPENRDDLVDKVNRVEEWLQEAVIYDENFVIFSAELCKRATAYMEELHRRQQGN